MGSYESFKDLLLLKRDLVHDETQHPESPSPAPTRPSDRPTLAELDSLGWRPGQNNAHGPLISLISAPRCRNFSKLTPVMPIEAVVVALIVHEHLRLRDIKSVHG